MSPFDQLRATMATALKIPASKITVETKKEDLPQWDSLAHLNLMMTLEQTFDITLEVEDFDRLNSVPLILEHLKRQR